jgi:Polyketide cyclase / dehydrase and lipid transport
MLKRLALAVALLGLLPTVASAHGPSRQKVTETIEINAPADKVWAVAKTEGAGANDPATATRKLTLGNGGTIDEKLNKYDAAAKSMSYEITAVDVKVVPVTNYTATISVSGTGDKSTVEWKSAFYRGYVNNDPPPELSDEAAVTAITGVFKSGLAALKTKIETPTK